MNSSTNFAEQQRQFLEAMATHYSFTGDSRTVFLSRFDEVYANKENSVLARFITWSREAEDRTQKLQDELKKICQVLEKDGCPISKPKRGRQPKGKSPWEQAFKWLWEEKFRDWQQRQNPAVLSEEEQKEAVCRFLEEIENNFKYDKLLHIPEQPIILKDQYIPIQVTLERKYTHAVETTWGYAESDAELRWAYALKRLEESQPSQVDWKEAKKQHQRIMVLADPGMGKSTLLGREACLTAQEEGQSLKNNAKKLEDVVFPLFLRLSDLAETPEEIIDAIPVLIQRDYSETAAEVMELLREKLKIGKCLLLLDALDEVPTEHRKRLVEKLNRFAQRKPPCPIICTSRIVGYGGAFVAGVKEVEIVPFSQKQIEQYIETWFRNAAEYLNDDTVSASSLIRELRNKPQIRGLAQNPLLLSLICSLYQEKGLTLPARRCQVYEQAVRYMLGKWSKNRNPELNDAWIDAKTELLEELAYQFSCDGKEIFPRRELRHKIDKYLRSENASSDFRDKKASCLITELSEQDGILQKLHKDSDEQYLFLHRTFQEYLTACYLKQASNGITLAREHFWEYEWHETLSLLAGLMENPVLLLQSIADQKDDIFSTLLLLAGRCVAECEEISAPLITQIINRIYKLWQSYPSAGFIKSTIVALGQANSQMFKKVKKALEDEDTSIRMKAAKALGEIRNPQAEQALIKAIKGEDGKVRMGAAEALGWIGTSKAVAALSEALNDKSGLVRRRAIKALGQISTPKAHKALIQAVKHNDILVRREATQALRQISSTRAEKMSITGHNNDSRRVRKTTVSALGGIDNLQRIDALIAALNHENNLIRMWAAQVLGQIGTPKAERELIAALNDDNRFVRSRVAEALVGIGTLPAVQAVIIAVKDKGSTARREATRALGEISNLQAVELLTQAVELLTTVLNDDDSFVRLEAAKALSLIGTKETLAKLIQLLEIDIHRPDIFPLARTLAVRFSKERLPFIPVYPELVAHKQ